MRIKNLRISSRVRRFRTNALERIPGVIILTDGENFRESLSPVLRIPSWDSRGSQSKQPVFTGKSAGCPGFLPVGRGGEGGNGLPQWSQSRPYNRILRFPEAPPYGRVASLWPIRPCYRWGNVLDRNVSRTGAGGFATRSETHWLKGISTPKLTFVLPIVKGSFPLLCRPSPVPK